MGELSRRERAEAVLFYVSTAAATLVWWLAIALLPEARHLFFGADLADGGFWIFLPGDVFSAGVAALLAAAAIARGHGSASWFAWAHFGGQSYAFLASVAIAAGDPRAYPGMAAMLFSAGAALAFAMRVQRVPILWGPFRFSVAPSGTPQSHWRASLRQTAAMWSVFLMIVPGAMVLAERWLGWNAAGSPTAAQLAAGALLFVAGGSLGIWAGRTMAGLGEGTPLPSACAQRLVVAGPYRFIRNPMALGGIVQGMGVGIAAGSALVVVYAILGAVYWEVLARSLEEEDLHRRFGESFDAYRRAVPCWRFRLASLPDEDRR